MPYAWLIFVLLLVASMGISELSLRMLALAGTTLVLLIFAARGTREWLVRMKARRTMPHRQRMWEADWRIERGERIERRAQERHIRAEEQDIWDRTFDATGDMLAADAAVRRHRQRERLGIQALPTTADDDTPSAGSSLPT